MIVVATDAPLDARNLRAAGGARRVRARADGVVYANGSGDFAIAFSTRCRRCASPARTGPQPRTILPTDAVSPLFEAVLEATEEAVDNSLLQRHGRDRQRAHDSRAPHRRIAGGPEETLREVHRVSPPQAIRNGRERTRFPVAAKIVHDTVMPPRYGRFL